MAKDPRFVAPDTVRLVKLPKLVILVWAAVESVPVRVVAETDVRPAKDKAVVPNAIFVVPIVSELLSVPQLAFVPSVVKYFPLLPVWLGRPVILTLPPKLTELPLMVIELFDRALLGIALKFVPAILGAVVQVGAPAISCKTPVPPARNPVAPAPV